MMVEFDEVVETITEAVRQVEADRRIACAGSRRRRVPGEACEGEGAIDRCPTSPRLRGELEQAGDSAKVAAEAEQGCRVIRSSLCSPLTWRSAS